MGQSASNPSDEQLWAWCARVGAAFSVFTSTQGDVSRVTASLDGYAVSDSVEHGDPRNWKMVMTALLRRLQRKATHGAESAAAEP